MLRLKSCVTEIERHVKGITPKWIRTSSKHSHIIGFLKHVYTYNNQYVTQNNHKEGTKLFNNQKEINRL